jgi:hypothetical protein
MSDESTLSSALDAGASADEFQALHAVICALRPLDQEARNRILEAAAIFLGIPPIQPRGREIVQNSPSGTFSAASTSSRALFSEESTMSPKEFLMGKAPKTDVERIACLAYYLTHYRDTPHFKTLDISALNTEAAQPKFSNTANSTNNAVKLGYIVPSTKGHRQLSALGERFVQALPDRNAAKEVLLSLRRRNRNKRKRTSSAPETSEEE